MYQKIRNAQDISNSSRIHVDSWRILYTDDFWHAIGIHDWLKLDQTGIENSGELNCISLNPTLLSWINLKSYLSSFNTDDYNAIYFVYMQ